jgi:CheY-like chemotaxis protein
LKSNTGIDQTSPHILVVEDDRETRTLIAKYLRSCNVTTATDGREMTKIMGGHRIDLLILNVMLPGEGGLTLCRKLRAESPVLIIMLTARGEDVDRILGLEMGADDYLPKPFNPREPLAHQRSAAPAGGRDHGERDRGCQRTEFSRLANRLPSARAAQSRGRTRRHDQRRRRPAPHLLRTARPRALSRQPARSDAGPQRRLIRTLHAMATVRPDDLLRSITNVVENAVKFGTETTIRLSVMSGDMTIDVEDDGPGISDADKAAVLEPFVRGDHARNMDEATGFGLGLSIANSIAAAHGGELSLHDRQPKGLIARIRLPLRQKPMQAAA